MYLAIILCRFSTLNKKLNCPKVGLFLNLTWVQVEKGISTSKKAFGFTFCIAF